jgi:hypothetical protein
MARKVFEKKRTWGIILAVLAGLTSPVWAGPPFETDDPEPTEFGHWEVYLGTTVLSIQQDFSGTAPVLSVNYGGFPDTQLSITQQISFNFPGADGDYWGYGDTLAGVKYRFLHESDGVPQAAVFPQVNFPTGDSSKGLGSGQVQFLLPLWLQKSWGPWTTFGGGGYWINPGPGNQNWVFLGWEIQRDLSSFFTLGGEVFYHSANLTNESDSLGFNLGAFVHFDEMNHIVFSAGRDILQPEYQFTGFLAYEWTFPKGD